MSQSNFERMIQLADDVFSVKDDPQQLDVNEEVIERLKKIHPSTVSEYDDGNGPVAWVLLFPTTNDLMNLFLENKISEKELYEKTPLSGNFQCLYLCSALVLEEYRKKGIATKLAMEAIENIMKDQPINCLFVWAWSNEGKSASQKLSKLTSLPLHERRNIEK